MNLNLWTAPRIRIGESTETADSYSFVKRVLIAGLIGIFVIVVAAQAALPWALGLSGHELTVVHGPSMGSAAANGSIVVTESRDSGSLRIGDIVVFEAPWALSDGKPTNVVHRLELITPTTRGLLGYTAGDANVLADPEPIALGQSQQAVVAVIPHLGILYSSEWTSAANLILVILLIAGTTVVLMSRYLQRTVTPLQTGEAIA